MGSTGYNIGSTSSYMVLRIVLVGTTTWFYLVLLIDGHWYSMLRPDPTYSFYLVIRLDSTWDYLVLLGTKWYYLVLLLVSTWY